MILTLVPMHASFPQAYAHRLKTGRPDHRIIEVYNRSTGKTLWSRTIRDGQISWSADKRAVAVEHGDGLLVWRSGERVRNVRITFPPDTGGGEPLYEGTLRWSPDKRRLSMINPMSQGGMTIDTGCLFVVQIRNGSTQHVWDVRRAEWKDTRTVRTWGKVLRGNEFVPYGPKEIKVK